MILNYYDKYDRHNDFNQFKEKRINDIIPPYFNNNINYIYNNDKNLKCKIILFK